MRHCLVSRQIDDAIIDPIARTTSSNATTFQFTGAMGGKLQQPVVSLFMSQPSGSTGFTLPMVRYPYDKPADPNRQVAWPSLRQEQRPLIRRVPSVRIRQSRPEEAIAIWNVLKAAVNTLVGRPYTRAQVSAWIADEEPKHDTRDFAPGCTVFVAESERRIIGFSRFSRIELEALYVHPAQAGRKVGELLLKAVERSASAGNVKTLALDAALNAVSFYESAGYRVLGRSTPLFDNGIALPCVRMQKTLQSHAAAMPCSRLEVICDTAELSPNSPCPYRPRLPKRSRPDHWPSRAGCYRAWRG